LAKKKFRFDFALSFAGSQRDIARKLRNALVKKGFEVFFDEDYESEMLGVDGSLYLRRVYSRESRYCIILVSKEYDRRDWPNLERESIQSRELKHERDILLPVFTDSHKPEWLPETRFYFDLSRRSLKELVKILEEKSN
jgi:hypothetical protein